MSEDLKQQDQEHKMNHIDQSSEDVKDTNSQENLKFNQAQVNQDEPANGFNNGNFQNGNNPQGMNHAGGQQYNNPGYNGQPGYNNQGNNGQPGYNNQGYNGQPGYNNQGYNGQPGYNNQGYNGQPGYNNQGYNGQPGYNNQGYNGQPGYNNQGYNGGQGYNNQGYNGKGTNNSNEEKKDGIFGGQNDLFKMIKEQPKMPTIKTEEDAREVYYGINQEYYRKAYKQYKSGKKISWNWSAFIFRSYWFFSRKMYAIGALYTIAMSFVAISVTQIADNIENPMVLAMAMPWGLVSLALWIATGMFANYIYMSHMDGKIVYPSDRGVEKDKMVQLNVMRGGFSVNAIIICALAKNVILVLIQELVKMM